MFFIINMFSKFSTFWKNYGFEICVVSAILFIGIIALFRIGKKGTWSNFYITDPRDLNLIGNSKSNVPKRRPPTLSKGEKEMTEALQRIFGKPFIKARPDFLRNTVTSGAGFEHNLELDAWNPELGIAAEFQGAFHHTYSAYYHKNKEGFLNQKYRDELKRRMCKDVGITLIGVFDNKVKLEDIEKYLREELTKKGFSKYFVS
jgi:hypothetical protein